MTVGEPEEAVGALAVMLGWAGGLLPRFVEDGVSEPVQTLRSCERGGMAKWLWDGVRRYDRRLSQDVSVGLPVPRDHADPVWSTVLWVWVEGSEQVFRSKRLPVPPSMVLRIGEGSRRLLLWWMREELDDERSERALRRLAFACKAPYKHTTVSSLRVPLPGGFVRVGRSRPAAVLVTRLEDDTHSLGQVVGQLKDAPAKDAWRQRQEAARKRSAR